MDDAQDSLQLSSSYLRPALRARSRQGPLLCQRRWCRLARRHVHLPPSPRGRWRGRARVPRDCASALLHLVKL